ncbi:MAG: urease accessory protein UreF [Rhizobiales bacterium]|nr:urease accessory protein UreF [Hyphomicrobiales bacterium]MBO6699773.1 urease accessory protein UreF [Hyphomicrobiales bacterium]MBO6737311.1 urease accessory protein UreF [Hyphomicrobiales bacterium]MBO6911615.1 urease accessory protein UreF [Hyphomicrobiales bacterium]MBO6954963.1 urease accessory protein UreF [Hyphomicrobiales bacterium]
MSVSTHLVRLMAWLSPVFPTGGFAYSAGLEQAVADDLVRDETGLQSWLETLLARGSFWNEAVLIAVAHRQHEGIEALSALAASLAPSAERHRETLDQGAAFLDAASAWAPHQMDRETPLPVALGTVCAQASIPLSETLTATLQTLVSNQLQAAIRLSLIGQTSAARLLASLEPVVLNVAAEAERASLDDLGGSAFLADIVSARHETLEPRLFLS